MRRHPAGVPLLSVVGLYLAVTLCWLLVLPPFEGPDELQHYDYARYVAVTGHLPDRAPAVINEGGWYTGMWVHEGLYYWLFAQVLRAVDAQDDPLHVTPNPRAAYEGGPEPPSLLHARPLSQGLTRGVIAGRLLNMGLGLGTIVCAFFALTWTTGRSDLAALASGSLILVPEFSVRYVLISNDPLAAFFAGAAACLTLRWATSRPPSPSPTTPSSPSTSASTLTSTSTVTPGSAPHAVSSSSGAMRLWLPCAIGTLAGCAAATKMPAASIVLMLPIACWAMRRDAGVRLMPSLIAWAIGLAIGGAWPFVRNIILFGDPLAMPIKRATMAQLHYQPGFDASDWRAYGEFARLVYRSFWATIGWSGFRPPVPWIWGIFAAWSVICGAAIAWVLARSKTRSRAATISLAMVIVTVLAFVAGAARFPGHSARYLLPVAVPALVVVAEGLRGIAAAFRARFGASPLPYLCAAGVVALALAWLGTLREVLLAYHFGGTS